MKCDYIIPFTIIQDRSESFFDVVSNAYKGLNAVRVKFGLRF